MCSFGSRALGHGIYTFDRRLHHLRSALSSMLEQHISAHLWRYASRAVGGGGCPSESWTSFSATVPPITAVDDFNFVLSSFQKNTSSRRPSDSAPFSEGHFLLLQHYIFITVS